MKGTEIAYLGGWVCHDRENESDCASSSVYNLVIVDSHVYAEESVSIDCIVGSSLSTVVWARPCTLVTFAAHDKPESVEMEICFSSGNLERVIVWNA